MSYSREENCVPNVITAPMVPARKVDDVKPIDLSAEAMRQVVFDCCSYKDVAAPQADDAMLRRLVDDELRRIDRLAVVVGPSVALNSDVEASGYGFRQLFLRVRIRASEQTGRDCDEPVCDHSRHHGTDAKEA
jgi:hypothetical protein